MPLLSKILFALSIVSLVITAFYQLMQWLKYKKEIKAYQLTLHKLETEHAREARLAKEAEVIRRFNEMQRERAQEEVETVNDKL